VRQRLRLSWAGAPATYGTTGWLARYPWRTRLAIQMVGRHWLLAHQLVPGAVRQVHQRGGWRRPGRPPWPCAAG
jgi:hypothetical protein